MRLKQLFKQFSVGGVRS